MNPEEEKRLNAKWGVIAFENGNRSVVMWPFDTKEDAEKWITDTEKRRPPRKGIELFAMQSLDGKQVYW